MSPNLVLWIYIALLLAGGLMGFLKAGSKASLIMSVAFAIPLALCAANVITMAFVPDILLNGLLLFFLARFGQTKKFMPGGLMALLSGIALIAHLLLRYPILR